MSRNRSRRSTSIDRRRSAPPLDDCKPAPIYCVISPQPIIISSEQQPNLSKLTATPVYLYHATSQANNTPQNNTYIQSNNISSNNTYCQSNNVQTNNGYNQSNIYSPIPNSLENVVYPHITYPNMPPPAPPGGDTRSNMSQTNALVSEKDFTIIPMNPNMTVAGVETKEENRVRRRKSSRPWRGYIVERGEVIRHFQSVAVNTFYDQEAISDGDTAISISSATNKLLLLHKKFLAHRKVIDDGRKLEERTSVNESIPFNEAKTGAAVCECSEDQLKSGIHHHLFPRQPIPRCVEYSNNANLLHHYRLVISPETNFVTRDPTTIYYDGKDFSFEGYSIFTHVRVDEIPAYTFTRNFIDYTVEFIKVDYIPEGFCIKDLDLVSDYLFNDIMELFDWKRSNEEYNCRRFHFMPRFIHRTQDLTTEVQRELSEMLSMGEVLQYLMDSCTPFTERQQIKSYSHDDWKEFAKEKHGCLVSNVRNKPRTIRVDDVTYIGLSPNGCKRYPDIVHLTPKFKEGTKLDMKEYGDLCAKLTKAKRAVKSRAVPRREDQKLVWSLSEQIQKRKEIRGATRWIDISFTSRKYLNTGLRWDICQHASYLPALSNYLRFMLCTSIFERNMNYKFKDKSLLKVALTHPSHMDTASYSAFIWNMLQNVGKQYPHVEKKYKKVATIGAKKKGVIYMTNLMANLFNPEETRSTCRHNERLEFLGDAILDYLTSLHLFLMFPEKGPGKLTAFRSGIVQTENLSDLARKIGLEQYILVQHRVAELNKSESYLGNALEAVVAAVYLDGGLVAVDNLLSFLLFIDDAHLCKVWNSMKKHPLQEEHPGTDRHLIEKTDILKKFVHLENQIGVEFKHIRLLARAFTQSIHGLYDPKITGGNYERLEFLGDAILKYVSSDYLYRHFPTHQEGHLTLLRSSLVNSRCLAQAARELGLNNFIIFQSYRESSHMKEKVCSDVFEALLGALHIEKGVDKGIVYCNKLVEVCILSRLKEFIINQEWLDPKSQLQQCCHSLRDPADPLKEGKEYFHPIYKKLKSSCDGGVFYFKVGVYVNKKKLGVGEGRSTKDAEKEAAKQALCNNYFEQYAQQKRIIFRKFGRADGRNDDSDFEEGEAVESAKKRFSSDEDDDDDELEDDDEDEDEEEENEEEDEEDEENSTKSPENSEKPDNKSKKGESGKDKQATKKDKHTNDSDRSSARNRDSKSRHRSRSSRRDSRRRSRSRKRSEERSRRKRSRDRSKNRSRDRSTERRHHGSPLSKRSRTSDDRDTSKSRRGREPDRDRSRRRQQTPQMEISLEKWISGKGESMGRHKTKSKVGESIFQTLELEAITSDENADDDDDDDDDEVLETITSSENGSEELEPITSSENGDAIIEPINSPRINEVVIEPITSSENGEGILEQITSPEVGEVELITSPEHGDVEPITSPENEELETVISSGNREVPETITSSENEERLELEVISSSDYDSDLEDKDSEDKDSEKGDLEDKDSENKDSEREDLENKDSDDKDSEDKDSEREDVDEEGVEDENMEEEEEGTADGDDELEDDDESEKSEREVSDDEGLEFEEVDAWEDYSPAEEDYSPAEEVDSAAQEDDSAAQEDDTAAQEVYSPAPQEVDSPAPQEDDSPAPQEDDSSAPQEDDSSAPQEDDSSAQEDASPAQEDDSSADEDDSPAQEKHCSSKLGNKENLETISDDSLSDFEDGELF